jgi:hypothetical protein
MPDSDAQCWHTEPDTPCDWNTCRQPERLAAGDHGTDPAHDGISYGERFRTYYEHRARTRIRRTEQEQP